MATASSSDDPWSAAKQRYLEGLNDEEKALFLEATPENLLYKTSNESKDERKRSKLSKKLQPLIAAVQDYGQAVDVYSNIAPIFIAPIWGSIRVLLVLAQSYDKFYVRICDLLSRVADILPRLNDYQRIFDLSKHIRLRNTLTSMYVSIIDLCMRFRQILQSQRTVNFKRLFKPIFPDQQYEEVIEEFRRQRKSVEKETKVCHMIEDAESQAIVIRNRELQKARERRDTLRFLSTIDYAYRHTQLKRLRHASTGDWLSEHDKFVGWKKSRLTTILCCFGIPGCGKSVLTSTIVDNLASTTGCLAYYYCDYSDKRTLPLITILSTLAKQILQHKRISEQIENLIEAHHGQGDKTPSVNGAIDILVNSLLCPEETAGINQSKSKMQNDGLTTLIIDGIDEISEEDQRLLSPALLAIINKYDLPLRVLLTARHDLSSTFPSTLQLVEKLHIKSNLIALDIEGYIKSSVDDLLRKGHLVIKSESLRKAVVEKLLTGSQGMFLWVKFQMNDLCEAETDSQIIKILSNLPKDLAETYSRILDRITGPERRILARKMFQWIACAKRPLKLLELREAIAFEITDRTYDLQKLPTDMKRLIKNCGNLLVVEEDSDIVHFAHHTVQQFLVLTDVKKDRYVYLDEGFTPNGSAPMPFILRHAERMASIVCVVYLSFPEFEGQITRPRDDAPAKEIGAYKRALENGRRSSASMITSTVLQIRQRKQTSAIDFAKFLPPPPPKKDIVFEDYHFLHYAAEYWLSHSSSISMADWNGRFVTLFRRLLFEKSLMINTKAWGHDTIPRGLSYEELLKSSLFIWMLGWTFSKGHLLVLLLLEIRLSSHKTNYRYEAFDRSQQCIDAIWRTVYESHTDQLSPLQEQELERLGQLEKPPQHLSHHWAQAQLLQACRRNFANILNRLLPFSWEKINSQDDYTSRRRSTDSIRELALSHMMIVAIEHQATEALRIIMTHAPKNGLNPAFLVERQGQLVSATHLAMSGGNQDILKILLTSGRREDSDYEAE